MARKSENFGIAFTSLCGRGTRYALVSVPNFMLIAPDGSIDSRNLTVTKLEQRLQELLPYRARRDTAVSSVPDTTGFVKRLSI